MKIILAYSGGLDTSVLVHWYAKQQNAEVITYCADVGQEEELEGLEEKALSTGATAHRTLDLVDEFARDFIYPMVRGNAVYESQYLLGTSIARPLIAKAQIDIAREFGATAVAHGATGKGNDQCRFELTFSALAPDLRILAPWRDAEFRETFPGRRQMIEYCAKHGIDVEASASKPYSMDRNLWHISYEAGILEDPWFDPTTPDNRDMYKLTVDPELAPDEAQYLELTFERGDCVAIDGESGSPLEIVRKLNVIAGKHGIGRVDLVENRFVGMKSRGVYETPGGTILLHAHRQLETLTMDRDLMHLRDSLIPRYAELIYYGFWYAPEREALQALIDHSQDTVSGVVRLKLYKGNLTTVGRKSELSLYDLEVASMDDDESDYQPEDAGGFIRLNALRLKERSRKQGYTAS
ncbi:MAG: argininosuccinate synthase [Verrucomicrobiota bacterium]|jgi:argininosuccinate synthase|nr:argininosuccinate synthase [Verrucomicrobiota bacterium]HAY74118.1 argininosuccinate synthase [Opitutae bacterium]MEC7542289.1 argininosuccinate synthase [Verrucomicrobiota bacterium]MEC8655383.1 argininosuccinate synthase [Verrucomicrobiota bacterium]MEC8791553.1 argininosuccinate synthase [Verrucomicrobiota bacterium]|tara:strand:+ start:3210 stop:4436 length:1227 start_codon:yes stop_codon:yes gene_type:complete